MAYVVRPLTHSRARFLADPIHLSNPTSGCASSWGKDSRLAWCGLGTCQPPPGLLGCWYGSSPCPGEAHRLLELSLANTPHPRTEQRAGAKRPAMEQALFYSQLLSGMRRNWFGGDTFLSFSLEKEMGSTEL